MFNQILIYSLIFSLSMHSQTIFDFNEGSNFKDWIVIDDVVMGGKSSGSFEIDENGNGVFKGDISLENNGGFSSVRHNVGKVVATPNASICLVIKGDGKEYQFRIKENTDDYYSFIYSFTTNNQWQEIEIPLKDMYPSFRGKKLNQPNFSGNHFEQITFLIANKKNEQFKLTIDKIFLK